MKLSLFFLISLFIFSFCSQDSKDLNLGSKIFVIERGSSQLAIIDINSYKIIKKIKLSGNLRHASMVFGSALHYGYIATRNGNLIRINLETLEQAGFLNTSENSIGIAISQDGKAIAVAEYKPGGVTIVDVKSFSIIQKIPAKSLFNKNSKTSRVTGLVDGGRNTFLCALMDSGVIWELCREKQGLKYRINREFNAVAEKPFDALITPEGRYYITGHFKSDRVSLIDLWSKSPKARSIVFKPKTGDKSLANKMVHMESWAVANSKVYIPSAGEKRVSILSTLDFTYKGSIDLIGDPVYALIHPNHKELWVSFSGSKNDDKIQIIDTITNKTKKILTAGKRIYHMAFSPKGDKAFVSANESNELILFDCFDHSIIKKISLNSPSGIFGVWRAFQIGL